MFRRVSMIYLLVGRWSRIDEKLIFWTSSGVSTWDSIWPQRSTSVVYAIWFGRILYIMFFPKCHEAGGLAGWTVLSLLAKVVVSVWNSLSKLLFIAVLSALAAAMTSVAVIAVSIILLFMVESACVSRAN